MAQRNLTCAIRIRERRRQLGLTQAEVVDRVNGYGSRLSNQALSAIENGRRLAVGRLPDLAAALQCTVSYLLGLTADPGRWEPDDAWPAQLARAAPSGRQPSGGRARPNGTVTNSTAGRAIPPRRGWILGPDLPDAVPSRTEVIMRFPLARRRRAADPAGRTGRPGRLQLRCHVLHRVDRRGPRRRSSSPCTPRSRRTP